MSRLILSLRLTGSRTRRRLPPDMSDPATPAAPHPNLLLVIDPDLQQADHKLLVSLAIGMTVLLDLHRGQGTAEVVRREAVENLARQVEPWLPGHRDGRES